MFHLKPDTRIMGVVNITPDSFFEGSRAPSLNEAKVAITRLWEAGAHLIDIGAESTRPGATPVTTHEELERLYPVLEWLQHQSIPFSVDTRNPVVMTAVLPYKPTMINDIYALQAEGALEAVANSSVEVCLMHMQKDPQQMQQNPVYENVVEEIKTFFEARLAACAAAGIDKQRIWVDPGFGFGKTLQHNLKMLQSLPSFEVLGCRVMVGMSRKAMFGAMLNKPVEERVVGSLTAHTVALLQGANMIRTHDVAVTKDAMKVLEALRQEIA